MAGPLGGIFDLAGSQRRIIGFGKELEMELWGFKAFSLGRDNLKSEIVMD